MVSIHFLTTSKSNHFDNYVCINFPQLIPILFGAGHRESHLPRDGAELRAHQVHAGRGPRELPHPRAGRTVPPLQTHPSPAGQEGDRTGRSLRTGQGVLGARGRSRGTLVATAVCRHAGTRDATWHLAQCCDAGHCADVAFELG